MIISDDEFLEMSDGEESQGTAKKSRIISEEEFQGMISQDDSASFTDYLRAVPATAVDIVAGSTEGLASALGEFTGDYELARNIGEIRTDINDVIMGDAPETVKGDFAYKLASGLGSTIPYLGAALVARRPSMLSKVGANAFFLSSAGQQVRDDYLATQGVTSETATDEQMSESVRAGAIGAVPLALAEKLGAGAILKPFTKGAIPAGKVMERISQYAAAGAGEAATEVMQSGIINSIASYVSKYDEDRPITRGMAESALIGFLVGGGVNAGIDTVDRALTQSDRMRAGVQDGSLNANDVIDPDVGSQMAAIAMENGSVPEVDSDQQARLTDKNGVHNFISKTLTPLSRRLGRAGREVVREFRKFEMDTGVKINDFKEAVSPFSKRMLELKKSSPEDYKILSRALANANELSESLPDSVQKDLEVKSQIQPELVRSSSEQLLDSVNPNSQIINQQIDQARQALEKFGLKTNIHIIESGNSYYDPSSNTIAISAEQADGTTVAHEYFHAVLGQAVKTDLELQSMTRNMFDSVIRATVAGSSLNEQLKGFVSQYDSNVQNEEFLAQTVGELASQYETLDINTKTRIKIWINQVMQKIGVSGVFKEAQTDADVIEQLNAFARFAGQPEALTEGISRDTKDGIGGPISSPIRGSKLQIKDLTQAPRVDFDLKPRKNSNVDSSDSFDMLALLDDIVTNNLSVTFWAADQMGIGDYKSPVSGKKYFLDAGLGFAKNKKGKAKDYVWASTQMGAVQAASKSDIVMIFSGDPDTMHYFNKVPATIFYDNIISKYNSVENFANTLLAEEDAMSYDKLLAKKFLNQYADADAVINNSDGTVKRKLMEAVRGRLNSTNSDSVKAILEELMPSNSDLVDAHLKHNEFGLRDIYAAFKPNGSYTTTKTDGIHNTYKYGIAGEFLGTPDIKVNLEDIINTDLLDELKEQSYEEYLNGKKGTAKDIGKVTKKGIRIPDMETAESIARGYGLNVSKLTGGATGAKTFQGDEFRSATPKQVADAIARKKAATASSPDEIAKGAKAIKKKQLPRVKGTVNFKKWMGKGQLVHDDGEPMVLYHGTKEDFTEFTSKGNLAQDGSTPNWLYFATNPSLSEDMAAHKQGFDERGLDADEQLQEIYEDFSASEKSKPALAGDTMSARSLREDEFVRQRVGMLPETFERYSQMSVMPVYLNAKNIWNPSNASHVSKLMAKLRKNKEWTEELNWTEKEIASGEFRFIENVPTTEALAELGFDGAFLAESPTTGLTTVAIWDKTGVKSATGNSGAYSSVDPDIRRQKERRERTATEEEIIRGLSDDGMRLLEKHGMVEDYRSVRETLNKIKDEYKGLGLDANFIDNYFPRLVQDLKGLKESYGQDTGIVDQEIRRYEKMTGQTLSDSERQVMYEKLARSRMYRGGASSPSNMKERRTELLQEPQMKYYADPEVALDNYIEKMVNAIETKKLIGDAASGKTEGSDAVAGRLGEVMKKMADEGRLRDDQIEVIQGAVQARFGQHGSQYGFVKGAKNMGYLATMGNVGSTLTQLGDFYFTMVQNGLIPTIEAVMGKKNITVEDLGIAKDMVEIDSKQGAGMFSNSVKTVFKWTGLTAMDRLAKNTNINAAHGTLTKGAKASQNSNKYKKTLARLKRTQGNDAYKTIADLQNGVKSDLVLEALYNELSDVAPISLTEMPEAYAGNPNLRIMYSLKSYTIKQFNFVRERVFSKMYQGIATKNPKMMGEASADAMKILAFSTLANGSADVLKNIIFNREIDEEDLFWNNLLRIFGVSKYTTVQIRKEGLDTAILKTIAPPQLGVAATAFKDAQDMGEVSDMRSLKYMPFVGKLYYWREGRGSGVEERLSRLRETKIYPDSSPLSDVESPRSRGLL